MLLWQPGIVNNMLENLEWPSLESKRKLSRLTMFHRVVNRKVYTERDTILCCFWDLTSVVTSLQIVSSHGLLENIKNNDILRLPFATILLSKEDKEVVLIFNNNVIYRIHYNVILSETDVMQWFCFISQNKVDVDIELAVVDPAEGPGGPAPLIIEPNCGPRGRKKLFWRPRPHLISRSGSGAG